MFWNLSTSFQTSASKAITCRPLCRNYYQASHWPNTNLESRSWNDRGNADHIPRCSCVSILKRTPWILTSRPSKGTILASFEKRSLFSLSNVSITVNLLDPALISEKTTPSFHLNLLSIWSSCLTLWWRLVGLPLRQSTCWLTGEWPVGFDYFI